MAADLDRDSRDGYDEVIVSAGGGAVGFKLLETALAARALSGLRRPEMAATCRREFGRRRF